MIKIEVKILVYKQDGEALPLVGESIKWLTITPDGADIKLSIGDKTYTVNPEELGIALQKCSKP